MYIPDEYNYMDNQLIELFNYKFEYIWNTEIEKQILFKKW